MIERYDVDKHYPLIEKWFLARKQSAPMPNFLPDRGFVSNGIAIGFLVTTNSALARIENVIVDKNADQADRGRALKALFSTLEEEAKNLGYFAIEMLCDGDTMSRRLADSGFLRFGEFELFYKEIPKCRGQH